MQRTVIWDMKLALLSFKCIPLSGESGALHFQSVILRKQGHR